MAETAFASPATIAFGPVPSRRLGRSIGINHVPPKTCSYSCVYCQVGRTSRLRTVPRPFYAVADVLADVRRKVDEARAAGEAVDYLTFVPDGEPTLDRNLAALIDGLTPLGIPIAVISNGSLLWRGDVREALARADWVSLGVDGVGEDVWRRVNRPHRQLRLATVLDGMLAFAGTYRGELTTETMLVAGVNDEPEQVAELAAFLARLRPARAWLAVPTRPPAEPWVAPPPLATVMRAFELLRARVEPVELLIEYEGDRFAATGAVVEDLLAITAVHPMREDAVRALLVTAGADAAVLRALVEDGRLIETIYDGHRFYARRLKGVSGDGPDTSRSGRATAP